MPRRSVIFPLLSSALHRPSRQFFGASACAARQPSVARTTHQCPPCVRRKPSLATSNQMPASRTLSIRRLSLWRQRMDPAILASQNQLPSPARHLHPSVHLVRLPAAYACGRKLALSIPIQRTIVVIILPPLRSTGIERSIRLTAPANTSGVIPLRYNSLTT